MGLAVYDTRGSLATADGPSELFKTLPAGPVKEAIKKGENRSDSEVRGRFDGWTKPFRCT